MTLIIIMITVMIPVAMAMTAPTSVLSTSFVSRVINGVVVKQPDDEEKMMMFIMLTEMKMIIIMMMIINHLWKKDQ